VKLKISYADHENFIRFVPNSEAKLKPGPLYGPIQNLDTYFTLFRRAEAR
jgi:hypothetical protein